MSEHKIGEQWVEEIDGIKHMYKAVEVATRGLCSDIVVKDLGILNEDGCLPSDFGVYPEVYEHTLMGIDGYMVKAYTSEPHIGKYAWGNTKQQAIDAWNRRA